MNKTEEILKELKKIWNNYNDAGGHDTDYQDVEDLFIKSLDTMREETLKEMAKIKGVGVKTIEKCLDKLKTKNEK